MADKIATGGNSADGNGAEEDDEEKEEVVLRDFTIAQLREFDGTVSENAVLPPMTASNGEKEPEKIYISLRGNVYDVTSANDLYGPEQTYHCMAGREASRALALLSFEESDLSNTDISDLGPFHRETLDSWEEKYMHYKNYPVVGKCLYKPPHVPAKDTKFEDLPKLTIDDISTKKGEDSPPDGRVNAPIYLGICGKVLDVSFGGTEMYGPGGPYHLFAGIDASKALAKMSFKPEDVSSRDLSDLTDEQKKVLADWEKRFIEVKKYPIVGQLI